METSTEKAQSAKWNNLKVPQLAIKVHNLMLSLVCASRSPQTTPSNIIVCQ
jgi:hypothetical protein